MTYYIILLNFYFITEAIKKMKRFSKFDTIDVENPLRIFIAGPNSEILHANIQILKLVYQIIMYQLIYKLNIYILFIIFFNV